MILVLTKTTCNTQDQKICFFYPHILSLLTILNELFPKRITRQVSLEAYELCLRVQEVYELSVPVLTANIHSDFLRDTRLLFEARHYRSCLAY